MRYWQVWASLDLLISQLDLASFAIAVGAWSAASGAMLKQWLRDALDTSGKSQKALADHLGIDPTAVSKMLTGVRQIKADELVRIARFLGVDGPSMSAQNLPTVDVRVTAIVAAGVWREPRGGAMLFEGVPIPAVPSPKYKGMTQKAVRVDGTDFARTIQPGRYVIYVPASEARRKPQPNDIVYITRQRGDLVEHTLRRVHYGDHESVMELHSEPADGPPDVLHYPSNSRDRIEIVGFCLGVYAPL